MSRKYRFRNQDNVHFVTCTVVNWIDVFTRNEYRNVVVESIKYCQQHKGLEVYAYVIMPSHIHLIIGRNGEPKLEHIMRDMKAYTSGKIRELISNNEVLGESRRECLPAGRQGFYGCFSGRERKIRTIMINSSGYRIISL